LDTRVGGVETARRASSTSRVGEPMRDRDPDRLELVWFLSAPCCLVLLCALLLGSAAFPTPGWLRRTRQCPSRNLVSRAEELPRVGRRRRGSVAVPAVAAQPCRDGASPAPAALQ